MLSDLKTLLKEAEQGGYVLPCFNVFSLEYALAVIQAAEKLKCPAILGVSKVLLKIMPLSSAIGMLRPLAENATIPVCIHLDHQSDLEVIFQALDLGFKSVMYDGSQLELKENIRNAKQVVRYAEKFGVGVEAEVGSVPYLEGNAEIKNELTVPEDVKQLHEESGVSLIAVSVGNLHRSAEPTARIQFDLLRQISAQSDVPLCIHGGSGVVEQDLRSLVGTRVLKVNIGTALRIVWYRTLKDKMNAETKIFDTVYFLEQLIPEMEKKAAEYYRLFSKSPSH